MDYANDGNLLYVHEATISSPKEETVQSMKREKPSNWLNCLICGQKKFKGDTKLLLIQSKERCDNNILDADLATENEKILLKIQREYLIAKEGLYHNK